MSVQIVATKANAQAGKKNVLVNAFQSGNGSGYVKLESSSIDLSNPLWPRIQKRSATFKGTLEVLEAVVEAAKAQAIKGVPSLPGRIQIRECQAGSVPADLRGLFFRADLSEDENIAANVKRAGSEDDAPTLELDGQPILRFSVYDQTGQKPDETLAHDNVEEIAAYREAKVGQAQLPGGGN